MRNREVDGCIGHASLSAQECACFVELRKHRERLFVENLSRLRQARRIHRTVDQIRAEPRFERLNAPRERRLRDMPHFGRPAETTRLRERDEIFEPFQFHAAPWGWLRCDSDGFWMRSVAFQMRWHFTVVLEAPAPLSRCPHLA